MASIPAEFIPPEIGPGLFDDSGQMSWSNVFDDATDILRDCVAGDRRVAGIAWYSEL